MDRKGQLRNVAFGGAWSEQIAGNEALTLAMRALERAIERTAEEDLRGNVDLDEHLRMVSRAHPKGELLAVAWARALDIGHAGIRAVELARLARAMRAGLGKRVGSE